MSTTSRLLLPGSHDRLTAGQRRVMVGAIVVVHVAAIWALLQLREVRDAVMQVAPMFVSIVAPDAPPKIEPPPPPPPVERRVAPTPRVVVVAPSEAPAPFVVAAPPPEIVVEAPSVVVAVPAPVVAPPAPAPQPRTIPASAVQYLEPLQLEYPRLSKRLAESGRVLVRVFIDEAGLPRNVQVSRTSGHPRLDEAAVAAVQKARFKPYTENGQAHGGWASVPIDFELER